MGACVGQHGLDYFPKWLCAVPYSPVTGPRLLRARPLGGRELAGQIVAARERAGRRRTSTSIRATRTAAFDAGWLARARRAIPLAQRRGLARLRRLPGAMDHKHRKNIRQERARSPAPAWRSAWCTATKRARPTSRRCTASTCRPSPKYGNTPALTLDFVRHLAHDAARLVLFLADREGETIAGALCLRGGDTCMGATGARRGKCPGCISRPATTRASTIACAKACGAFEPGAQGEHKLARWFLPTLVHSRHWIAHPDFEEAIARWCADESPSGASLHGRASRRIRRSARAPRMNHHARCCHVDRRRHCRFRLRNWPCADPEGLLADGRRPLSARGCSMRIAARHLPWYSDGPADPVVVPDPRMVFRAMACTCHRVSGAGLRHIDVERAADTAFA